MDRVGQSRRHADRKIKLAVWRIRIGVPLKAVGILLCFVGIGALIPVSIGSPKRGLNKFDFIAGTPPLLPTGGWLLLAGVAMLVVGTLITREWEI